MANNLRFFNPDVSLCPICGRRFSRCPHTVPQVQERESWQAVALAAREAVKNPLLRHSNRDGGVM